MNRKELVKTLELVHQAVSHTGLVPVFGCFMFDTKSISAFNGDALAIKAETKEGLICGIEGKTLLGLLQNSNAEDVTAKLDENEIRFKAGKSNFKLPYLKKEEFLFEEPDEEWLVEVPITADLINGIETCLTTACRDASMPALLGVSFNFDIDPGVNLFTCDGDAITQYDVDTKAKGKGIYMVPNSFCDALLKIWHETEALSGTIEISCNWAKASLATGFTVYGRILVNEKPLDLVKLIKDTMTGKSPFVAVPEGFNEALSRARVVADFESAPTLLTVYEGKLGMLTESKVNEVRDDLVIKDHDDVEASVYASLVQRSISVCDEISIRDNCTAYRKGKTVLQVVSNVGE